MMCPLFWIRDVVLWGYSEITDKKAAKLLRRAWEKPRVSTYATLTSVPIYAILRKVSREAQQIRKAAAEERVPAKEKRTDTWLMSLRVQFPSGQPVYGSMGTVTYDGEKVKAAIQLPF